MPEASAAKQHGAPGRHCSHPHCTAISVRSHVGRFFFFCAQTLHCGVTRSRLARNSWLQVETKNGELYRGELYEAEDNWNCQMRAVQMTARVRFTGCHFEATHGHLF